MFYQKLPLEHSIVHGGPSPRQFLLHRTERPVQSLPLSPELQTLPLPMRTVFAPHTLYAKMIQTLRLWPLELKLIFFDRHRNWDD